MKKPARFVVTARPRITVQRHIVSGRALSRVVRSLLAMGYLVSVKPAPPEPTRRR
jgi:hypothetical protein